jgi:2-dehydropantoate 2-reductase
VVLSDPNAAELARALAQEAAAVASAMRIALPFNDPWSYVRSIVEQAPDLENSMLVDLRSGVQTENDHISGAVVAAGRRAAVPTPYNDTMFRLIRAREGVR